MSAKPIGRPPKYRSDMCDQIVEWGRQGKSKTWMAAALGTTRKTLHEWESDTEGKPEFGDAMARAMALAQQWWEDAGQAALGVREFQASVWSRSMAARFPDDWRERAENRTTHDATDKFVSLLGKIGNTQSVFPGDDEPSAG